MFDNRRKSHASRSTIIEMLGDLFDHIGDGVGHSRAGSINSEALADELACFHVNRSAFDSGSTDVDSKKRHSNYPPVWLLENRTWRILREISEAPKPATSPDIDVQPNAALRLPQCSVDDRPKMHDPSHPDKPEKCGRHKENQRAQEAALDQLPKAWDKEAGQCCNHVSGRSLSCAHGRSFDDVSRAVQ